MADSDFTYTREQFKYALKETLNNMLIVPSASPKARPEAVLLGGQSGAGKSTLHRVYKSEYNYDVIVINGDEYRKSHPHFEEIQERYGVDASAHTAKWAGEMTEALIDALSLQGYNLVIEGTLRTSEVPLRTARLLKERGYEISLAVMAVKPEVSLMSCQIRYELMRLAGTTPRATDPEHHNKVIREIADNLSVLEESGEFLQVRLYNRSSVCLYPADEMQATSASEVLKTVLFGEWTVEETTHYESLIRQLTDLKKRDS